MTVTIQQWKGTPREVVDGEACAKQVVVEGEQKVRTSRANWAAVLPSCRSAAPALAPEPAPAPATGLGADGTKVATATLVRPPFFAGSIDILRRAPFSPPGTTQHRNQQ